MRTLNADQLKAVLSMESSLGHIHTLADVENTIDYLAKEEPEAVAGVEKFNIFDTMWSRKIQAAFPQSFVNMQNELVFSLRTDSGFSLKDVTNETQLKAKILEWLTRTAIKAVSPKERKLHFEGINKLLGTNFTLEEMTDIYTYLGNGINHDLCVKFVENGYDRIYDRPRKLQELTGLRNTRFGMEPVEIARPPQSWGYVRELEEVRNEQEGE